MAEKIRFQNFDSFFEYYMMAHQNKKNLALHFWGTSLFLLATLVGNFLIFESAWLAMLPFAVLGYGMAWFGHFKFEKNKPATFGYPFWSFRAGILMYIQILIGKIKLNTENFKSH